MATNPDQNAQKGTEASSNFAIQRLYVKNSSFESPNSPQMFRQAWQPAVSLDMSIQQNLLEKDIYEVLLRMTVTVKSENNTAFLAEVEQAGIFFIQTDSFNNEQLDNIFKSYCPNILFPYGREAVTDMVIRGGFPPLYLAPVNFDALLQQQGSGGQAQGANENNTKVN